MKIHKNIISFTLLVALCSPAIADDVAQENFDEVTEPVAIHAEAPVDHAAEQNPATEQTIAIEGIVDIIDELINTLEQGTTFTLHNADYIVDDAHKGLGLSPDQLQALAIIASEMVSAAIEEISEQIQLSQKNPLTHADAIALLQACQNNLTIGSKFTLNGTTYHIIASN